MNLKEIGIVESCYQDRFAIPRQSLLVSKAEARIVLHPWVQPEIALDGLMDFSHLWVIFGFHLNKPGGRYHAKVRPPRLKGRSIGVFACRTPHRPNPIGLSLVEIVRVNANTIEISGGDLANKTPVYDIKPYLPETEIQVNAKGGWSSMVSCQKLTVEFANVDTKIQMEQWAREIDRPDLQELVFETLKEDPRPLAYLKNGHNYNNQHKLRVYNGQIHFMVQDDKVIIYQVDSTMDAYKDRR